MISWNVGLQGFWNVRTAISRLCSDTHPGIMFFQDLKVALSDRQKAIRECRRIAPFYKPYLSGGCDPHYSERARPFSLLTLVHTTLFSSPDRLLASKMGFTKEGNP